MKTSLLSLTAALALSGVSAHAAIFAVNFTGAAPTSVTVSTVLFAPNIAAADFTNAAGFFGAMPNVGSGSGTTTTWSADGVAAAGGFNLAMGEGQLLSGNLTGILGTDIVVTISGMNNISYDYDVTLAAAQNSATGYVTATLLYGVTSVPMPFSVIPPTGTPANPGNAFGLTNPVLPGGPGGSEHLSTDSFIIRISGADTVGGIRNALAGIAVDFRPIPEPGSAALAGLAALGLLRRRRA